MDGWWYVVQKMLLHLTDKNCNTEYIMPWIWIELAANVELQLASHGLAELIATHYESIELIEQVFDCMSLLFSSNTITFNNAQV